MSTPLHPLIVHFPIVMLLLGVVAQFAALWKRLFFDKAATYLFVGGFISGIASYLTGEEGEDFAEAAFGASETLIETHSTLALWTLVVFGFVVAVKLFSLVRPLRMLTPIIIALSLIGGGLISATGHYGGQIVYHSKDAAKADISSSNVDNNE